MFARRVGRVKSRVEHYALHFANPRRIIMPATDIILFTDANINDMSGCTKYSACMQT